MSPPGTCRRVRACCCAGPQGHAGEPLQAVREIAESGADGRDRDGLVALVAEGVASGGAVLVFCASRAQCQSAATLVAGLLPALIGPPSQARCRSAE